MAFSQRRGDRSKNLVGFTVGDVHYAVDILRVKEIVTPRDIVPIPHPPPAVLGVSDHRGEVVPVIDLRRRFGLPSLGSGRRTKWVFVGVDERRVALVVDSVTEVFAAGPQDQRAVPEMGMGDQERGIGAVYSYSDHLVFVLDVERIAAVTEEMDLSGLEKLVEKST